ncbi:MAG: FKBP-type peptidyl-prolyl cis-trans isomerase [Candidatus Kapabacteria bacterium]|nr:FKBP-type peptidyl-prolyl cis-trans isomerase [Candidatus Kapabacteria bacterium]
MKVFLTAALACCILAACESTPEVNAVKPANELDSTSYAIGVQIGKSFKQQSLDVDINMLAAGMRDVMAEKSLFADSTLQSVMMKIQERAMKKMQEDQTKKADSSRAAGDAFLAQNKTKPGVITTASGLQYQVVSKGNGPKPTKDNTVKVHYTGSLIDGSVFDSSVQRGQPVEFPVTGVIPGWTEILQLMNVGSKVHVVIPSALAYGDQGSGQSIPPGSVLVFDVELIAITK